MNSLFEIVLWGAPAVLLSWGLLLVLVCAAVFREFPAGESLGVPELGRELPGHRVR